MSSPHVRAALANRMLKEYDEASIAIFREGHRNHLGASVIGEPCEARNWFAWRWIHNANPGGRMYRLFQRGHREEPFVFMHLRQAGHTINELDPTTGKQWRLSALHGHFGGSCDGRGFLPARYEYEYEVGYEVKTANLKQFRKCKADGVAKWKPKYARQMDVYGRAWGLRYFVFTVVCKDDDETYFEIYECNYNDADRAHEKAERVITARTRPARISDHPSFSECRYCDFHNHCHKGAMPEVNCRSCKFAVPSFDGKWFCEGYNAIIPDDVITVGCNAWKSIL
jgi:hypothetical protein